MQVAAGNAKLMKRLGIEYKDCHHVGTVVHMAVDGKYAGHILISDILKPHAKEAIANLKKAGVAKTVMLTGDARNVAESVAAELGIGEVHSELLPADKVAKVESFWQTNLRKRSWYSLGMESTMRRFFPEQISESPWVLSDQMLQLKQPTLS